MNFKKPAIPINTNGIYIRKINPFVEFQNFKFSRLMQIWDIILGKEINNYYSVIVFNESSDNVFAKYKVIYGEVFDIILQEKKLHFHDNEFKVQFNGNKILMVNKDLTFYGTIYSLFDNIHFHSNIDKKYHKGAYVFISFNYY